MISTLFISYDLSKIKSANYQTDIFNELKKKLYLECLFVDDNNFEEKLINTYNKKYELIIVGHYFLSDKENYVNREPEKIDFNKFKSPIVFFLNKEYVNLKKKILWINKIKPNIVLTHSNSFYLKFKDKINSNIRYLPFAANEKIFGFKNNQKKNFDLSFSGILQNQNISSDQTDMRLKILRDIFITIIDIPLIKKKKYRNFKIFWNSIPRTPISQKFSRIIYKHSFLSLEKYASIQKNTKIYLNTLSPEGIISPRYYENFLSKSLVLSEKSKYLSDFENKNIIDTFNSVDEFYEKLSFYLNNDQVRNEMIDKAYNYGFKYHTWKVRIENLIEDIINKL